MEPDAYLFQVRNGIGRLIDAEVPELPQSVVDGGRGPEDGAGTETSARVRFPQPVAYPGQRPAAPPVRPRPRPPPGRRAAGQALEPACDPASARRHRLPAKGAAVPAHGQLAVAADPLWRAGDLSPPAGIARHMPRSKGPGVWSPAVRQLGAAGAGELPWCGDRGTRMGR
jgi:hypothetical protein